MQTMRPVRSDRQKIRTQLLQTMLQRSSSRPRIQEIHVTTHGTNIKHVLIHPQQRAETQARVYRLSRIQTDGTGSPGHAEIWLRGRVRVRGRRQRRKIQDPAPRTGQQLRQRTTKILHHNRRIRKMGQTIPSLARRRHTHTDNPERSLGTQRGTRSGLRRTTPRIRLLEGEDPRHDLRLFREPFRYQKTSAYK